ISPERLATLGYLEKDLFFAPDADVLFDESFAEAHCFGVTRGGRDRDGQVGLSFKPRRGRKDFVDVEGTLWMSTRAIELVDLEYRYTGVDQEAARIGAGGTMHFRTMPN